MPVVVIGDQGSVFNDTVDGFVVDASDCTVAGVGGGEQPATGIHSQFLALHWLVTQSLRKLHEKIDSSGRQSIDAEDFHNCEQQC